MRRASSTSEDDKKRAQRESCALASAHARARVTGSSTPRERMSVGRAVARAAHLGAAAGERLALEAPATLDASVRGRGGWTLRGAAKLVSRRITIGTSEASGERARLVSRCFAPTFARASHAAKRVTSGDRAQVDDDDDDDARRRRRSTTTIDADDARR